MAILGIGVDVVDLERFARSLERTPTLRTRLFTPAESELPLESLAGRFAAKEAFVKAMSAPAGLSWHDIEVVSGAEGQPSLRLRGAALDRANERGMTTAHVSISHDTIVATAFVVTEC